MKTVFAKFFFVVAFGALVLIGSQINFSQLVGAENQFFTLTQFFGPISGGFLGPLLGGLAVLLAQGANLVLFGKNFELLTLLRLLPLVFAAIYFGGVKKKELLKSDWIVLVPLLAIILFVLHPVGREVWYFSLYWTIPILVRLFFAEKLFFKSLGATFTAHAVGGVIWIYTLNTATELWNGLIPVVAYERMLFALGITASYLVMNTLLLKIENRLPKKIIQLNPDYSLSRILSLKS